MSEKLYMVDALKKKLTLEVFGVPTEVNMEDDGGLVGFLPVYKTREEAETAYPNVHVRQITTQPESQ